MGRIEPDLPLSCEGGDGNAAAAILISENRVPMAGMDTHP